MGRSQKKQWRKSNFGEDSLPFQEMKYEKLKQLPDENLFYIDKIGNINSTRNIAKRQLSRTIQPNEAKKK